MMQNLFLAALVLAVFVSVSYTHLDVYKRQLLFLRFTIWEIAKKGEIKSTEFSSMLVHHDVYSANRCVAIAK